MRMIALVAARPLVYGHRCLRAGDRFEATPIDAAVLTYHRQAAFAPRGPVAEPPPAPVLDVPEAAPTRRRTRRRALEAEDE